MLFSPAQLRAEPFRIFFPLATLIGVVGVLLWPAYFAGLDPVYPGLSHVRLMTQGFFGGFILGFLGTALPRMISVRSLAWGELVPVVIGFTAAAAAQLVSKTVIGDLLFLATLGAFLVAMGLRWPSRRDLPPPGFVLVILGMACEIVGLALNLATQDSENARMTLLARLLTTQGFVLLPILGVGPFILPRFFGLPNRHDFPESKSPVPAWRRRMILAGTAGSIVVATFLIEALFSVRAGLWIRCAVCAAYLMNELPVYRPVPIGDALVGVLRIGLICLVSGYALAGFFPGYRVAWIHATLAGGFGLITLTVATRVIFGHSNRLPRLTGKLAWFWTASILMLLGMTTRISGDFLPRIMASHYVWGALLWAIGILVWLTAILTINWRAAPDESEADRPESPSRRLSSRGSASL